MAEPIDPNKAPSTPPPTDATEHKKGPPPRYGEMTAKPMTFLGMHFTGPEAQKLWETIMQQINSQIQHEQARALKAMRKLRKSSTGGGGDD